ncbi:MAG: sigma-70 family RNA polymerase sigma factor [Leptospiraceae bacterium]|nr:sigma-70 family RNA polymerase sigma factor [Leptospiraceae bacterium]
MSLYKQPQTQFPNTPKDRWINWKGELKEDDWKYIFTESVYKYIFKTTYHKCNILGFDQLTCEEIAVSVTGETILAVQAFCKRQDGLIKESIRALINTIANTWFKHFISRFYIEEKIEYRPSFEKFISGFSGIEEFVIRTELLGAIFQCMEKLSETSRKVIRGIFFENLDFKTIANNMNLKDHKVIYIKKQAEKFILDCMKSKGY